LYGSAMSSSLLVETGGAASSRIESFLAVDTDHGARNPHLTSVHGHDPVAREVSSQLSGFYLLWLALRTYHVWCMFIGLLMVVAVELQILLTIYVDFFSNAWVGTSSSPGEALFASAMVSMLSMNIATALSYSAVWLMRDAWRLDCFLVFRSLILFKPLHVRVGVPLKSSHLYDFNLLDIFILLMICIPLDVVPMMVVLMTGNASDWAVWTALIVFVEVLVFWILEVLHDYVYKAKALRHIFSQSSSSRQGSPSPAQTRIGVSPRQGLSATFAPPPEVLQETADTYAVEPSTTHNAVSAWYCNLEDRITARPFVSIIVCVVLGIVCIFWQSWVIRMILLSAVWLIARFHVQRFFFMSMPIKVRLSSREERDRLCACLDDYFHITTPCVCGEVTIPVGAQLVSDGFLMAGDVRKQLAYYPIGAVLAFRLQAQGVWSTFIETHCGASPEQLVQNGLVSIFLAVLGFVAMSIAQQKSAAFAFAFGMLVYASPALCVFVWPRMAQWCHVVVSVFFASLAVVTGMAASNVHSGVFWCMPLLGLSTHFLLHRRLHYMQPVAVLFTLLFASVIALFLTLSVGATLQDDSAVPDHSSSTFTFPEHGTRNPYTGPYGVQSPACALQYPTSNAANPLLITDFSFLNYASYMPNGSIIQQEISMYMKDWELVKEQRRTIGCTDATVCNLQDWASWFVFQGRQGTGLENTTVVTIRGTKTQLDMIFDLDLWSLDILGLNKFAYSFPFVGPVFTAFWDSPTIGSWWFQQKRKRYRSVVSYLQSRLASEQHNHTFYLTGHSLGGGLAQLVAAELKTVPAITLSSPGSMETIGRIGLDPTTIEGLVVNVIPKGDPIPASAGQHGDITVPIPCLAGSGPECHRVFNTACMLLRECGDPRQRVLPCSFCKSESALQSATCASKPHLPLSQRLHLLMR